MNLRKVWASVLALVWMATLIAPFSAQAGAKRRIAILPFEYGAVTTNVGTVDVGKGIVSLLITKPHQTHPTQVVERQVLDSILKEQNLSVSDRADPATACKIVCWVCLVVFIVGTVTQFGFETKTVGASGVANALSYAPYGGWAGALGGIKHHSSKVKVAVDARLVDINTSEILAAVHGTGESKRSGTDLFGGGYGGGGSLDWGSSDFATSIAGEATLQAVDQIGSQLNSLAAKIPDNQSLAAANVEGKVADVTGDQILINVGKSNGIASGDKLAVSRVYKKVMDPDTNKVLKELSNNIAIIDITSVDPSSSTGSVIKGGGVRVGDSVKKVTTDVSAVVITAVPGSDTHSSMSATGAIIDKKPAPTGSKEAAKAGPGAAEAATLKGDGAKKTTTAAAAKSTTK